MLQITSEMHRISEAAGFLKGGRTSQIWGLGEKNDPEQGSGGNCSGIREFVLPFPSVCKQLPLGPDIPLSYITCYFPLSPQKEFSGNNILTSMDSLCLIDCSVLQEAFLASRTTPIRPQILKVLCTLQ